VARYITERFMPDKAIDLMDEAAARLRMQQVQPPHTFTKEKATRC
jgi:ATP-dependent Clp protease ATP-binding subunit ClpA